MSGKKLNTIVFICGAATMILELVGSRLFAPFLGTSLFVWTSLIGIVLAFLSLGYWAGGKVSDRKPEARAFSLILLGAALAVACIGVFGDVGLAWIGAITADVRSSSVLAAILFFGAPSFFLGMVSPYAVRLRLTAVEQSGRTVGSLYALSTLGSIAGTFFAGFYLLAHISHNRILFLLAATLVVLSFWAYPFGRLRMGRAILAVLFLGASFFVDGIWQRVRGADFIDVGTSYNRVWIYDAYNHSGLPVRIMQINDEFSSVMPRSGEGLAAVYTRYYRLAVHFNPALKKALMIGGAGYSYPKDFLRSHPEGRIDVVEIDPKLTELAGRYFGLEPNARLRVIHMDARVYLNRTQEKYDAIFGDAFRSYSVPYHLTTIEVARKMYASLNPGGVVILNIVSSLEGPKGAFLRAEYRTFYDVFPQVFLFAVENPDNATTVQNWILVALKSDATQKFFSLNPEFDDELHHLWIDPIPESEPVLTDHFAPVDDYMLPVVSYFERASNTLRKRLEGLNRR